MLWYVVLGLFCAWLYSNRITSASSSSSSKKHLGVSSQQREFTRRGRRVSSSEGSQSAGSGGRDDPSSLLRVGVWRTGQKLRERSAEGGREVDYRAGWTQRVAAPVHPDRLGLVPVDQYNERPVRQSWNAPQPWVKPVKGFMPSRETRCLPCGRMFPNAGALAQHSIDKHFSSIAATGSTWHGLPSHQNGGDGPVICELCQRDFGNPFFLYQHAAHKHPWAVVCTDCMVKFSGPEEARHHYATVHDRPTAYIEPIHATAAVEAPQSRRFSPKHRTPPQIQQLDPDTLFHLPYPCYKCDASFASPMEREEHLMSPFGHGGKVAVDAAFPPLQATSTTGPESSDMSSRDGTAMSRSSSASSRADEPPTSLKSATSATSRMGEQAGEVDLEPEPTGIAEVSVDIPESETAEESGIEALSTEQQDEDASMPEVAATTDAASVASSRDAEQAPQSTEAHLSNDNERRMGEKHVRQAQSHDFGIDLSQPLPLFTMTPPTSADTATCDQPLDTSDMLEEKREIDSEEPSFEDNDWIVPDWVAEMTVEQQSDNVFDRNGRDDTSQMLQDDDESAQETEPIRWGEPITIPVPGPDSFPPLPGGDSPKKVTPQSSPEKAGRWKDGTAALDLSPPSPPPDFSHPSRRYQLKQSSEPDPEADFPPSMRLNAPPAPIYSYVADFCGPASGVNSIPISKRRSPRNRYRLDENGAALSTPSPPPPPSSRSQMQQMPAAGAQRATTPRFSNSNGPAQAPLNAPTSRRGWQHPAQAEPHSDYQRQHSGSWRESRTYNSSSDAAPYASPAYRDDPADTYTSANARSPLGDDSEAMIQEQLPCFAMPRGMQGPFSGVMDAPSGPPGPRPVPVRGWSPAWAASSPQQQPQPARAAQRWKAPTAPGPGYSWDPSNPREWGSNTPSPVPSPSPVTAHTSSRDPMRSKFTSPYPVDRNSGRTPPPPPPQQSPPAQRDPSRGNRGLQPQFAESEWQSVAPTVPTRKTRGGRAQPVAQARHKETFAQSQMRQAEQIWSGQPAPAPVTVEDIENDPYGGW